MLRLQEGATHHGSCGFCSDGKEEDTNGGSKLEKVPVREQDPKVRASNFDEVCLGYNLEEATEEAQRCLTCKKHAI